VKIGLKVLATNFKKHVLFINRNSEKENKKVRQREGASKQKQKKTLRIIT
jgi:hypothetical protein